MNDVAVSPLHQYATTLSSALRNRAHICSLLDLSYNRLVIFSFLQVGSFCVAFYHDHHRSTFSSLISTIGRSFFFTATQFFICNM
jgi:hypothetical protein